MAELIFDTGLKTYKVNGGCEIAFNPADVAFVKRVFDAFDCLAEKQDAIGEENGEVSGAELFRFTEKREQEMRGKIDGIFDEPVCDEIFGKLSVYALASGLPLWCNFLMAIIDEIDSSVEREQHAASPRVDKYMAKYAKYKRQ